MKNWIFMLPVLLFSLMTATLTHTPSVVAQADLTGSICDPDGNPNTDDAIDKTACLIDDKTKAQSTLTTIIKTVTQTLVFVVGGISVIMIIIGGFQYVVSSGDPNSSKRGKDTIIFALVGLLVALVAQGLVTFVIGRI